METKLFGGRDRADIQALFAGNLQRLQETYNIRLFERGGANSREYIALSREIYSSFARNLGLFCVETTVLGGRDGAFLREIPSFLSSCMNTIRGKHPTKYRAVLCEIYGSL